MQINTSTSLKTVHLVQIPPLCRLRELRTLLAMLSLPCRNHSWIFLQCCDASLSKDEKSALLLTPKYSILPIYTGLLHGTGRQAKSRPFWPTTDLVKVLCLSITVGRRHHHKHHVASERPLTSRSLLAPLVGSVLCLSVCVVSGLDAACGGRYNQSLALLGIIRRPGAALFFDSKKASSGTYSIQRASASIRKQRHLWSMQIFVKYQRESPTHHGALERKRLRTRFIWDAFKMDWPFLASKLWVHLMDEMHNRLLSDEQ